MRILIASDAFPPKIDGVSDTAATIARTLARRGHDVRVIAPTPGKTRLDGCRVLRVPSLPLPFYADVRMTVPFAAVAAALVRWRPDAAVALTPGPIGLATARGLPDSTPLVTVYTTDIPRYLRTYGFGFLQRTVERLMLQMSGRSVATLCPTEFVRADLAARGYPRLVLWGRGVDLSLFGPERRSGEMRRRLTGGEAEKPLVLYVGRLAREKRLQDLYEAACRLRGVRFALVGDGPLRLALERRFSAVPSVFTGFLRGVPLAEAFASADIYAFPSDSETFGQVVLQSMASGVAPIVVRDTAPAELAPAGVAGLHVPARSPDALAAAIASLAGDPERRAALGSAAAARARWYCWEALLDRLEALLGAPPGSASERQRRVPPAVVPRERAAGMPALPGGTQ